MEISIYYCPKPKLLLSLKQYVLDVKEMLALLEEQLKKLKFA